MNDSDEYWVLWVLINIRSGFGIFFTYVLLRELTVGTETDFECARVALGIVGSISLTAIGLTLSVEHRRNTEPDADLPIANPFLATLLGIVMILAVELTTC